MKKIHEKNIARAEELINSRVGDNILGYEGADGAIVRYRISTNDFVKGYLDNGIATMYKPKGNASKGYRYFLKKEKEESI